MTIVQEHLREMDDDPAYSEFDSDGTETVDNKERGCGSMDHGAGYLRNDPVPGGSLPAIVEINEEKRIPFKEGHFRHYKQFPGTNFELALVREAADLDPETASPMEYVSALNDCGITEPPGEIWEHLKRLAGSANDAFAGEHYGEMAVARSHDLLMWVGETYYDQPEAFIEEVREQGLNKRIPLSKRNDPPTINPGKTRLWLLHPKGIDNHPNKTEEELDDLGIDEEDRYTSAIIGYAYLTRAIYTEDADGRVPDYVQQWDQTDRLDVVEVGEFVSNEELEHQTEEIEKAAEPEAEA